ncbi:hypothetical protein H5968_13455 [Sphaerospermopsis sp. LEGE 00249]|nr:hypothetical protein [Sphaerospermopsis sp. LEGE 00249]
MIGDRGLVIGETGNIYLSPDSCTRVREACWKHQHSENRLGQKFIISRPNASPLPLLTPPIKLFSHTLPIVLFLVKIVYLF